ncbi:MAG: hypothetical protein WC371_05415 [Parachlamydiales bacterium]|jgi:hypothetical protein
MNKTKAQEKSGLSLDEALENLSTLASMEVSEKTTLGLLKGEKIVLEGEEYPYTEVIWLFPEDPAQIISALLPSFAAVLSHFEQLWQKNEPDLNDPKVKKALESIFALAIDAAAKIRGYFALFNREVDLTGMKEFRDLEAFWREKVKPKLGSEAEEWEKSWAESSPAKALDFDLAGLKDWQSVQRDQKWELFLLKDENGRAFFTPDLIKELKISAALEAAKALSQEDFFLVFLEKTKASDLQLSSAHLLKLLKKEMKQFFKSRFDFKQNQLAKVFSQALMALFLAANPHNLVKKGKSCLKYFRDFQRFLRLALNTKEYRQAFFGSEKNFLYQLVNDASYLLFTRVLTIKQELTGYLHHLEHQAGRKIPKTDLPKDLLVNLEAFDDNLRQVFDKLPSGPILKLVPVLQKELPGFDPLLDSGAPALLYHCAFQKKQTAFLHLPSPTFQEKLPYAAVVDELIGFLEGLKSRNETLLFCNLQDRGGYLDSARSRALEQLSAREEFQGVLLFLALNKESSFYRQSEGFADQNEAGLFFRTFQEKLFSSKADFFLSPRFNCSHLQTFSLELMEKIHRLFFLEKKLLSQTERADFIELFYHFFLLKLMEEKKPDFVAFSSKDGVDSAAALNGSFFAFLKFLSKNRWSAAEMDFLKLLFFGPALLLRHRLIDRIALGRSIGCLAHLQERKKELRLTFSPLYEKGFFDSFKLLF